MDWLTLTVEPENKAAANIALSREELGVGYLHHAAWLLEAYARDASTVRMLPTEAFRAGFESLVPLPADTAEFALITMDDEDVALHMRAPILAPFHAVAAAGVLRAKAQIPMFAPMIAQVVGQVMQAVINGNLQAQQDARIRETILRGGGRTLASGR